MSDTEVQSAPPSVPLEEDKPQLERKVIATLVQGTVKWFNVRNGYGFINRNDTKEDVFVHQTAIKKNNPTKFLRSVGDGEVVEFDVIEAPKGSEAANVTGPGGVPVKGSRYAPNKRRFRRRFFPRSPRPGDQGKPGDDQSAAVEGDSSGENVPQRPPQRRRRPRRPPQQGQEAEGGDQQTSESKDDQTDETRQPQRRRFWRPYRRPFHPRPPLEQPVEGQQAAQTQEQAEAKQSEDPQINSNAAQSQGQKPRRPSRRQRQRTSESSTSKGRNDTEKSASEPGTPPQTSEQNDPPDSPKESPEEAATSDPEPTE